VLNVSCVLQKGSGRVLNVSWVLQKGSGRVLNVSWVLAEIENNDKTLEPSTVLTKELQILSHVYPVR